MRARLSAVMLASAALALALGAGTLPAVASASISAATWTVTPGGQYRAQVGNDNFWGILDVRTNQEIQCTVNASAWSMRLRFKRGTGLSNPIGWVRSLSFPTPCFPGRMGPVTLSAAGTPWGINAFNFDPAGQVTSGRLTHMHLACPARTVPRSSTARAPRPTTAPCRSTTTTTCPAPSRRAATSGAACTSTG